MKDQRFGIEIEFTGITRSKAAQIAGDFFGRPSRSVRGSYNAYSVDDSQGRQWRFVSDGSINAQRKVAGEIQNTTNDYSVEMVSPICKWEDIGTIQELVRRLRSGGAFSNRTCGIHVHVDATPFDAATLRTFASWSFSCRTPRITSTR